MFPSSEHPYSEHRNAIGMQRALIMTIMGQRVAELRMMGYVDEAEQMLDELSERQAEWGKDAN